MPGHRSAVIAILLATALPATNGLPRTSAAETDATIDLTAKFDGFDGCFVLYRTGDRSHVRHNPERCARRLSPCSTFKIPNSLIGLETGVIEGPDHLLEWDGTKRWREVQNRDHDLRSAFENSVVWYYQALAAGVGVPR